MSPPDDAPTCPDPPATETSWPTNPELVPHETRNLFVLTLQQIIFRVGWVFKTESVIVPAFLDAVSGAGWLRGFLPVINRFGQSIPPVFWAERLRAAPLKKRLLAVFIMLMSIPFGVLAVIWMGWPTVRKAPWLAGLFLVLYLVFFLFTGLYRVSFGTLQGKLIRPTRRGRLLWMSTFWGTLPVVGFALWLMPKWFEPEIGATGGAQIPAFGYFFLFVAGGFFVSGLIALLAHEPADRGQLPARAAVTGWHDLVQALRGDANLRRLVLVVMLANLGIILFPHYQALGRDRLGLSGMHLVTWLVAQNVSIGVFSVLIGRLADAYGYRLTLQLLIVWSAIAPMLALGLACAGSPTGAQLYWCVFLALGVIPLGIQATMNYTLEICEPAQHACYLSTVNLCASLPFLFSPLVGWLIDIVGYNYVFSGVTFLILVGAGLSIGLKEPRHRLLPEDTVPLGVEIEE